ncbi:polymorphic toxin type 24 domain-containing protein [Kutzneria chonburiensis]|uniref:Polymorphic toxin type 24 domain-containing protein n=1 Tax=Kutzneria chonburiensis TaxID=1483604 RepID=A0ABV6N5H8_9PSEU|nr:polymorphic toxin type 24 domain-containing protein [Kutzneria chonburiensis]
MKSARRRRIVAAGLATALVLGLVPGIAAAAPAKDRSAPEVHRDRSIPVSAIAGHYGKPPAMPAWQPKATTWPSGAADVTLTAGKSVKAGALPMNLARTAAAQQPAAHVAIAPQATATAAGIHGVVFSLQRTDNDAATSSVKVSLDYTPFQDAFGGDWSSRLHVVELPSCALTTPDKPECRRQTPVKSSNNTKSGTVSADVTLASTTRPTTRAAESGTASPATVFAAEAGGSGDGGGDYSATSLKPSGSWQAGGSTDAFSWSYPIPVPSVPGGLQPSVGLSYSSQSVDGLISSTNNQPSWLGDGWDYSPGYIERSYQSCQENPDGATKTSDNCWSDNNTLTLSLAGSTSTLIKDDVTGEYHPQSDSGARVQYVTDGIANGAQNGEHFVVTTTDGTQYFFGLNQLPGWSSGKPTTDSVLTEPVYFTKSTPQGCYNADFSQSHCQQAYRWNLDYVKDTHNDVVSYFYSKETNSYAADKGTNATAGYDRGSYLARIQYGQRDGQVYSTQPAAQVIFTSTGRCKLDSCDPGTLNSSTATDWPDVPYDLNCASQAACQAQSPSFWSEYTLQSIQTQVLVGTTETNVDKWSLTHSFPATGDSTQPALWLSSITHTGQDTTSGSTAPIDLPAVTFTGTPLSNRVDLASGYAPITRQRMHTITTETGETITIGYSSPGCGTGTPTDPSQNTKLCYPGYWTPLGVTDPILDWFNKYIVTGVTEADPTGGAANDTIVTTYTPVGTPAWHHNDNPLTPANHRTWDQWRGYQGMIVTTGTAPDPIAKTQYTYFRGMDGDTQPGGTRSAAVSDSRGDPGVTDKAQYAGMTYEKVIFNGTDVVSDTVTDPWSSDAPTATHALTGLPAQQAFFTGSLDTKTYTPLAGGTTRVTESDNTFDARGRIAKVSDLGDVSVNTDDMCTTTTYADNTTAWILNKAAEVKSVAVNCSATPAIPGDVVTDGLTFYDGSTTLGAAPTVGDMTMTQLASSYTGATPNYITTSTITVDQYGRATAKTDPDNRSTSTVYTPATGVQPTSIAVTDPKKFTTTTTYDPVRNLAISLTDPAGYVTSTKYDAIGRLISVQKPGINGVSLKYSYTVANDKPSVVDSYALNYDGSYRVSETLYDSLLRARETQTQTPDNGRLISDTIYNTDGWVSQTNSPYFNSDPVSATYVQAQPGQVPAAVGIAYDATGRKTTETAYALGNATWSTGYTYGGNFTTTTPPAGAPPTTTIVDALGRATDYLVYHQGVTPDPINNPASAYDDTKYTYYPNGKKHTVVDAAGNSWSYQYNLLGQQTSSNDPDTGASSSTYDNAGQLITTTDSRGKQVTFTYDVDGRKTARYDTTTTQTLSSSNKTAAWTYDTVKTGYPTATTSISGGDTYTQTVVNYNAMGVPSSVKTTLTGEGTTVFPSAGITTGFVYSLTGYRTDQKDSAVDGLPQEDIGTGYDTFGEPTSLSGTIPVTSGIPSWPYVQALGYSEFGEPVQYTLPTGTGNAWVTDSYDDQTHALTDVQTADQVKTNLIDDTSYRYSGPGVSKGAGLVMSTVDKQNGGAVTDTQCYAYDYATRLAGAWSATDNCANSPSGSNVGGPNAYWQSWTYDAAGNRASQVDHDVTGDVTKDNRTVYNYPTPGSSSSQPHTLSNTTATGPNAAANTASYSYDMAGNTTTIHGGATGDQSLTWNDLGQLATDTTSTGGSSYVYDASGNLIVRRDPGKTTIFVGDEQLQLDTTTNGVSASRYYAIGGTTVAVRTTLNTNPQLLVPDRQGTDQLTIDAGSGAVTRRQFTPFGGTRGTPPAAWPGDKGFVGGTPDPTTQLVNLGAREYNPANGRFLSADPVFEDNSPNQMNGYDYAGNDPITGSDPSGLFCDGCEYGGSGDNHGVGCQANLSHCDSSTGSPVTHYCDGCASGDVSHPELANYGRLASGQNKDVNLQPSLGGRRIPTFDQLKALRLGGHGYADNEYGLAIRDWAYESCSYAGEADTKFCGAAAAAGLLAPIRNLAADIIIFTALTVMTDGTADALLAPELLAGAEDGLGSVAVKAGEDGAAAATMSSAEDSGLSALFKAACRTNSFAADTAVLMADGSQRPIQDVKVGDKITNADPETTTSQQHTVTAIHVTDTDRDFTSLSVATANGPKTITVTAHHLFWDSTKHIWTPAADLKPGDQLDTGGDGTATVLSSWEFTSSIRTYNLTVDGLHTFDVMAGATRVLVHNDPPGIDLSNAQPWTGNFPLGGSQDAGGPKNGVLYREQNGTVSNYAVYDENGIILRRVDLVGRAHGGVPTPHVQEYTRNVTPDGRVFPQQSKIATPAGPDDMPRVC